MAELGDVIRQLADPAFAERFAPAQDARRQKSDLLATPEGQAMLNGLINVGIFQRHQGSFPPAQYPSHYDFGTK